MSDDLDAIEESPQTTVTKELVEKRVQDWKIRLHALFQAVRTWALANGWRVDDSGTVGMHEELMQTFDVPATEQPTLRLDGDRGYALFKPKGLWVIGANGRIDLYTSRVRSSSWICPNAAPLPGGRSLEPAKRATVTSSHPK
ncbi:MAG: hypothetical protein HC829_03150 [Bacteroidales bacterium]|nr:hypothetical protein [Bacteroidales bacterium]